MRRSKGIRRAAVALVFAGTAAIAAAGSVPQAGSAVSSAFVRVNQVGYPATASKRAYLMSSVDQTGATFSLEKASGVTVFTGPIGANLGAWNRTYSFVHPLDFDGVSAAGTYTITVTGPVGATSPSFKIDTGPNVYGEALANALYFYQTERDGPNFITNELRTAPAHLNDANAMTYETPHANSAGRFSGDLQPVGVRIDASGGWWDAGDYIKGVQTLGYTTALLLHGVREFPGQMGPGPPPRISPPRRSSEPTFCSACGTTRRRRSTTRSGSAPGTPRPSPITTSGGFPRPTTRSAERIRCTATSATAPSFVRGRPAR